MGNGISILINFVCHHCEMMCSILKKVSRYNFMFTALALMPLCTIPTFFCANGARALNNALLEVTCVKNLLFQWASSPFNWEIWFFDLISNLISFTSPGQNSTKFRPPFKAFLRFLVSCVWTLSLPSIFHFLIYCLLWHKLMEELLVLVKEGKDDFEATFEVF